MRSLLLAPLLLSLSIAQAADAPAEKPEPAVATPITRALLLGIDANNDGIRDDIQALVANSAEGKAAANEKTETETKLLPDLSKRGKPQMKPAGSPCLAYMISSPKDQQRADLRMRQTTNGMPGTHPCDPVVSPLLDRPYEREFVQVGPVTLRK